MKRNGRHGTAGTAGTAGGSRGSSPWASTAWAGTAAAALAGLCLGLLALGPSVGSGYVLSYDMVFVPRPPFNAAMLGLTGTLPRAIPSDLVVTALAHVLPADLVQKLVLLSIFALACAGLAALLADEPFLARLCAGICYAWNPFVGERLILGQWALLLGYASLPWVVCALTGTRPSTATDSAASTAADSAANSAASPAASPWRRVGRLILALLPAAIGGFAAMCLAGLVALPVAVMAAGRGARRRFGAAAVTLAVLGVLSLPWLVPSLTRTVRTSVVGVDAFAARADTPFGAFGSLLMLGGAWNSQTVPFGYGGAWSALWLVVVVAALAAFVVLGRGRWPGLGVAAMAGLVIASIGVTEPGRDLLRSLVRSWPGFAVLRDGQQFVAPLALAVSVGLGLAVSWVLRQSRPALREVRWLAAVLALIAPVVLLPGLAWGAAGRLRAVQYPADWLAARRVIDADPVGGSVLLLPWAADRRFGWNHGEAVLDPWPRLLARQVIWNDGVTVGPIQVPAEDPLARELTGPINSKRPLTGTLRAAGVRYVIVDAGFAVAQNPLAAPSGGYPYRSRLPGCLVVLAGPDLVLYRLPG